MGTAVYPGSFDPVTKGHLNIIERAARSFDKLIVCVMVNGDKSPMFSLEERVGMLRRVTSHMSNVEVDHSDALLADYARSKDAHVIEKGLRAVSDFEREFQMAIINHKLNPGLDTVIFPARAEQQHISSTMVRDMIRYHRKLDHYLPAGVPAVLKKFRDGKEQ